MTSYALRSRRLPRPRVEIGRALVASLVLIAILLGGPYALLRWGHWPLRGIPTWDQISNLPGSVVSDTTLFGILTLGAWVVWLSFMVSLGVEVAALRHGRDRNLPGLAPVQRAVRTLVAWLVMSASASGPLTSSVVLPGVGMPSHAVMAEATPPASTVEAPSSEHYFSLFEGGETSTEWRTVTVGVGDSAWSIAEAHYGSGGRWRRLWIDNKDVEQPDNRLWATASDPVEPGWTLRIRAEATGSGSTSSGTSVDAPPPPGPDTVLVQPGEHFWGLPERCVADAWGRMPTAAELVPYWTEMVEANRDRLAPPGDPDLIYPGQEFVVPPVPPPPEGVTIEVPPVGPAGSAVPSPPPTTRPTPVPSSQGESTQVAEAPASQADTVDERQRSRQQRAEEDDGSNRLIAIAARIGATAALAAVTLHALARGRRDRRRSLRPGTAMGPRPVEDIETEYALAAASDETTSIAWRAAAAFGHALQIDPGLPAPVGLVVTSTGVARVHLADPTPAQAPFVASPADGAWVLPAEVDLPQPDLAVSPVFETLVTLGHADTGDSVFVDLESLGVLEIHGESAAARNLVRSIVAELALQPLDRYLDLTVVGLDAPGVTEQALVQIDSLDEDIVRRLERTAADCTRLLATEGMPSAPAARAGAVPRDGLVPTVVVAGDKVDVFLLRRLAEAALPGGHGLALW